MKKRISKRHARVRGKMLLILWYVMGKELTEPEDIEWIYKQIFEGEKYSQLEMANILKMDVANFHRALRSAEEDKEYQRQVMLNQEEL